MTNRREIIQAAAIAAWPWVTGPASALGSMQSPLYAFLIDERYAAARSAGARLAGRGASVHAVPEGDVTQLWLQRIGPAWKRQPVALAGVTARPALFCLEQLAFASGLRVVFHSEHVLHAGGAVEHRILRGGEAASLSERELRYAGPLWPARLADAIAAHREQARPLRMGPSEAALEPALLPGAQLLSAWIIAAA